MKRVDLVLSLVLAMSAVFVGSAQATLLDDYSTDQSSQYVTYQWNGSTPPTFARTDGMLTPTNAGDYNGGGFYWNGGETLMPGDRVSAVIEPDHNNVNSYASWVGLCLGTATSVQNPYRVMGVHDTTTGPWKACIEQDGSGAYINLPDSSMPSANTPSMLTLARGTGGNQNVITWTFSKIAGNGLSGTGTSTLTGLTASDALYFGTAGIAENTTPRPAWDNLTYSIPEPSALILLSSGLLGLLAYAWRKRK